MTETPYQKRDRLLQERKKEQMFRVKRFHDQVFDLVLNQEDPYKYNRKLFEEKKGATK